MSEPNRYRFHRRQPAGPKASMAPQRILGIVVAAAGVALLLVGMNTPHAPADQANNSLTGQLTHTANLYIMGGLALALAGFILAVIGYRGKKAHD